MKIALAFCLLLLITSQCTDAKKSRKLHKIYKFHKKVRNAAKICLIPGQPPAKNLAKLKWNKELAKKAQQQANRCDFFSVNPNDLIIGDFDSVGQNLAQFPTISEVLNYWFSEHKNYDFAKDECKAECKNYKQMVWSTTNAIGCGVKKCQENYLVICNYAPS
uniref:SCP domain-containing protein n=1 Tax=Trichobilharzia regenti TaxID=157069 RepID=A0AA85J1J4_TRIRE|nr:unnamed protein product [Trichobilharzia regenti]